VVHPWERIGASLESAYGWPGILLHVAAVAVTPPLVFTGADTDTQTFFQKDPLGGSTLGEATFVVGGMTPILAAGTLYLGGLLGENAELATAGAAVTQAVVFQFVAVTALKYLTDRGAPYVDGNSEKGRGDRIRRTNDAEDFNFNPFDFKWGVMWPSGHTASNMAVVSALTAFYPDEVWIPIVGYPAVAAIAIGMVENDSHWLSDIVAGALIGHAIGWASGRTFRQAFDARRTPRKVTRTATFRSEVMLAPPGIVWSGVF